MSPQHRSVPLFFIVACLLMPDGLRAQAPIDIGAFAGLNSSTLKLSRDLTPGESIDSRVGVALGGFVSVDLGSLFAIQAEAAWTQKGADLAGGGTTLAIKLEYIEVPLLLRFQLPLPISPFVYAGPALSFKTRCRVEVSGTTLDCDDPLAQLSLKSTDLSGVIGAGVKFGNFIVSLQYDRSLSDIRESPGATTELKNETWTGRVGFALF